MKKNAVWYELPIFFLLLCLINYVAVPDNPGFYGISPHPYWSAILLFGFRYGLLTGLATGLTSAALYLLLIWVWGSRYLFGDQISLIFYIQPSLFVLIGTLVGSGVERQLNQAKNLKSDIEKSQQLNRNLIETVDSLKIINAELEKRVTTNMSTLVNLYQGSKNLESTNRHVLYPAILEFFSKTINASEASLFSWDPQTSKWLRQYEFGFADKNKWPNSYERNEGLVGIASDSKKIFSLKDYWNEDLSKLVPDTNTKQPTCTHDCVIAVPLYDKDQYSPSLIYVVHSIPLLQLNSATINLLTFLKQWAEHSLSRALRFEDLEDQEIIDRRLDVYSYNYFKMRLDQEFDKSKTYYLPLTVGVLHIQAIGHKSPEQWDLIKISLAHALKASTRKIDIVAKNNQNLAPFCCLFSTLTEKQVNETIVPQFETNLKNLGLDNEIKAEIHLASFTPKISSAAELIKLAAA